MDNKFFEKICNSEHCAIKHKNNGTKTEESVNQPRDSLSKFKKQLFDKILKEDVCAGDFSGFVPENSIKKEKEEGEATSC